jgi:hypothetical protein
LNTIKPPFHPRLQALQAASVFAPGARRVIAVAGAARPLAALLREVNETVLGRNLRFETDAGASLAIDVAGRRLLRVTAASGVAGAETCLATKVLGHAQQDDLARLLQTFATRGCELRVMAAPLDRGGEGMSIGLPVARLADLLAIDLNQMDDEPEVALVHEAGLGFLPKIAAEMGDGLMAWLIQPGDAGADASLVESGGPDEMVEHLQAFLTDEMTALTAQLDMVTLKPGDPVCTVLGTTLLEGHSILCVRAEGSVLLGVIAGDAAASVLRAWNAARR